MKVSPSYVIVAEATNPNWQSLMDTVPTNRDGFRESTPLCMMQSTLLSMGYQEVQPQWCVREGGYWYLRSSYNIGDTWPAGHGRHGTLKECLEAAFQWHLRDPKNRQVIAYREALKHYGVTIESGVVVTSGRVETFHTVEA